MYGFRKTHRSPRRRRVDYENDPDTLVIEHAERDLYLVAPN